VTQEDSGDIPDPGTNFQKYAENWNFYPYDPIEVKAWGNPTDTSMGVSYSQWQPIIKAATAAINYINKWTSEQPKAYQAAENVPGTVPLMTQLKQFESTYSAAKTNAAKHAAWVAFWQWAGSYPSSSDTSGTNLGIVDQAYMDAHEPLLEKQMRILEAEIGNTGSAKQAAKLAAQMGDLMMQSGLVVPLYYNETIYLVKPNVEHAVANPWAWNNFYQFQYLTLK
jgi:peptide/nickel transport system substrate-binding protein/oligopeptide transport system substrate-binding protein